MQSKQTGYTPGLALIVAALPLQAAGQDRQDDDEHHDIEEIIVEATALPRTVQQLAQPTAVLRGAELARKQATSIGETVSRELGVTSTYFGPVASRPVIRGQYGERVRVLSNGLDSLDASALSEDHQTSVDGILANHIEIVRGPATLLYGSGAAGGLVNVVDNRIANAPPDDTFSGKLAFNTHSATGEVSGAGLVEFGTEHFVLHGDYSRRDTDDVDIPGFAESAALRALEAAEEGGDEEEAFGTVENSDSSVETGALGASLIGDRGYIGLSASRFDSDYGVPGHAHEEEEGTPGVPAEDESVRIDLSQQRFDLRGEYEFMTVLDSLRFRMASNSYDHTEFEGAEVGTIYETDGIDARLEARHRKFGRFDGVAGLQYKRIDFNAVGDEAFVPASDTRRTSLFLFEEMLLPDNVVLQASARIEQQSIDGTALPVGYDDNAFGGSIGLVWDYSVTATLAANLSLTERHPNATELYSDGVHVAVQRVELGSVTLGEGILDKETTANLDLTWRGNTERVDWTVTAFLNRADDYIVLKPTGALQEDLPVFEYTQVDAELYGYEAEARVELVETADGHLHARLFSDYVYGEERVSGAYLPRLPPLRYGLGVHYTIGRVELSGDATVFTEQDKTAANELPTDGYTLLGVTVSYEIPERGIYLFLRGSNLGDEDARQHSSPLKDTVPLPGRALQAGVRYEF